MVADGGWVEGVLPGPLLGPVVDGELGAVGPLLGADGLSDGELLVAPLLGPTPEGALGLCGPLPAGEPVEVPLLEGELPGWALAAAGNASAAMTAKARSFMIIPLVWNRNLALCNRGTR